MCSVFYAVFSMCAKKNSEYKIYIEDQRMLLRTLLVWSSPSATQQCQNGIFPVTKFQLSLGTVYNCNTGTKKMHSSFSSKFCHELLLMCVNSTAVIQTFSCRTCSLIRMICAFPGWHSLLSSEYCCITSFTLLL